MSNGLVQQIYAAVYERPLRLLGGASIRLGATGDTFSARSYRLRTIKALSDGLSRFTTIRPGQIIYSARRAAANGSALASRQRKTSDVTDELQA